MPKPSAQAKGYAVLLTACATAIAALSCSTAPAALQSVPRGVLVLASSSSAPGVICFDAHSVASAPVDLNVQKIAGSTSA